MSLSGSHSVGDSGHTTDHNLLDAAIGSLQSAVTTEAAARAAGDAGSQPLDADLTTIAALDSTTAGALVTDGSGWFRKTYAQLKTAIGLGNVDNTADTAKPISTATQTALDLKLSLTAASGAYPSVVEHGATAGTARPAGAVRVFWRGSVAPTNAVQYDRWINTTVAPYTESIYDGAAWAQIGSGTFSLIGDSAPGRRVQRPKYSVATNTVTGGTWTANAATTVQFDTAYADGAISATCVHGITTGSFSQAQVVFTTPVDLTAKTLVIWVKVPVVTNLSQIGIYLSSDTGFTNYVTGVFDFVNGDGSRRVHPGEWVPLHITWAQVSASTAGTGATRSSITRARINFTPIVSATQLEWLVGGVGTLPEPTTTYPNGGVAFCFDDDASGVTAGLAKLGQYGFPATIFTKQQLDGAWPVASSYYRQLRDQLGWEIAGHSSPNTHIDPETLTQAARLANFQQIKDWHRTNGFPTDLYAWPAGVSGVASEEDARRYFLASRGGSISLGNNPLETIPPAKPMALRSLFLDPAITLANVQTAIDRAKAAHALLIITVHYITASGSSALEISTANWATLVDYVATSGCAVRTLSDFLCNPAT